MTDDGAGCAANALPWQHLCEEALGPPLLFQKLSGALTHQLLQVTRIQLQTAQQVIHDVLTASGVQTQHTTQTLDLAFSRS